MSSFDLSISQKMEKIKSRNFNLDDISNYLKKRVKPGAIVVPLQEKRWTKVGGYWIFLSDVYVGMEDSGIDVLVVRDVGFFNFAMFALTMLFGEVVSVVDWNTIPGTNLAFEMWFVGDGVNRVALVFEVVEEINIEDS